MIRSAGIVATLVLLSSCSSPGTSEEAGLGVLHGTRPDNISACSSEGCLYVASFEKGATLNAYSLDGKLGTPVARIYGRFARLEQPMGVALDAAGNVYVTNANSIDVYAAGTFRHNDRPIRRIAGGKTALDHPWGIAVDQGGDVFVANDGSRSFRPDSVTVYAPTATGNEKPMRQIRGLKTGLTRPSGILLDSSSDLYVANASNAYGPGTIDVYAPGASGDALPIRSISGDNTQLGSSITGLAFDMSGNLYVANDDSGNQSVTIYAAGASGNVAPIQTISGEKTGLNEVTSVAVDRNGDVFVGCSLYDGIVDEFAAGIYGDSYPTQEIDGFYKGARLKPNIYGLTAR